MGRRERNELKQATAPRECGQWRGTSGFGVEVRGLPAALAAYLNQEQSLTLRTQLTYCPESSRFDHRLIWPRA